MLEKLIVELGGIVPKDLLGAGMGESSSSLVAGVSPNKTADLTEQPGTQANASIAEKSQGNATSVMESGMGGDILQDKIESGLMRRLEDVVQDVEDEAEFR